MKKKDETPEQVSAKEALERMRDFINRKEEFVNAVKANKDRRLRSEKKK